ncbi:hypothetical protein [Streptomyces sp. NPDC127112]|uniref:hypothetical protein n=1 Tax=Streptomyces sp. NPDC127112 TaxID=3345364 RepID=UPI003625F96F
MPKLLKKAKVGKEGVTFATPLPLHEHLPKEIHELISADPVRCQLFKDNYAFTKSPQSFAGAQASRGPAGGGEELRRTEAQGAGQCLPAWRDAPDQRHPGRPP